MSSIPFPWSPYPQQEALMAAILNVIETRSVGLLESPTGTGKSLSTICSSMYWLSREESKVVDEVEKSLAESSIRAETASDSKSKNKADEDDWLTLMLAPKPATETSSTDKKKGSRAALDRYKAMKSSLRKTPDSSILSASERAQSSARASSDVGPKKHAGHASGTDGGGAEGKKAALHLSSTEIPQEEHEFVLDPYDSDGKWKEGDSDDEDSDDEDEACRKNRDEDLPLPQILYCSRTHSQISQFVGEIKRSQELFADIRCISLASRKNLCIHESLKKSNPSDVRLSEACLELQKHKKKKNSAATALGESEEGAVSASSRLSTARAAAGNDHDRENKLASKRKERTGASSASLQPCPHHTKEPEHQFTRYALGRIRDIEELVTLGNKLHACPYYATRKSIRNAQIVCMPYSMLLQSELRTSLGIDLRDRVVIFDEAHNVVDTINQLHSAEMTHSQTELALAALVAYHTRFQSVLHGKNLYYVSLLRSTIQRLLTFFTAKAQELMAADKGEESSSSSSSSSDVLTANTFLFAADMDNVNLVKLCQYILKSNLVHRIGGFADHQQQKRLKTEPGLESAAELVRIRGSQASGTAGASKAPNESNEGSSATSAKPHAHAIRNVIRFLQCLMSADVDGRVVVQTAARPAKSGWVSSARPSSTSTSSSIHAAVMKYVLFNPAHHFQPIVDQARSVILLGGTMKPFSYLMSSLLPNVAPSKIQTFSCDHVIPPHHVAPYVVSVGPSATIPFEFTYEKRYSKDLLREFSRLLTETVIPQIRSGIVVFFSSYSYMEFVVSFLKSASLFDVLHSRKPIFIEPQGAEEGERLLHRYSQYAVSQSSGVGESGNYGKGAMLFCVMGGKLSEGINFTDDLARCVIVVGLPYPDRKDPILQERMKHANASEGNPSSAAAGKRLYEAICMRQVNQSIGRSIRHRGDYASILLLDKRYEQPHIQAQLPSWISRSLRTVKSASDLASSLSQFLQSCRAEG